MSTLFQTTAGEDPQEARDITRKLARYVVTTCFQDLPEGVRHEIGRSLVNWLGVAIGGSRHEAVEIALAAVTPFSGPPQASLVGRSERLDVLNAALINGISSHVFDFDDTDLMTAIHPSAPVMPTVLALAELNPVSGRDLVTAIAMGFEVECRLGRAVQPALGAIGWHPTGVVGVFGAAVAAGKLLGIDEERMCHAVGLAATQPIGVREMFGSMTKSFHPGRAAQNGLLAAFLAGKGYTSSLQGIEAKCGWARLVSAKQDWRAITDGLGEDYEIYRNSYKPFACGLVVHPVIDGCIQLRNEHNLTADMIERIVLDVDPIVLELTNKRTPQTGLEGKFSVYYVAALAVVAGCAGEAQFSNRMVCDPVITALRDRVSVAANPSIAKQQARVQIHLKDGRVLTRFIAEAVGSIKNPMNDAALDAKFMDLADGILPADRRRRLIDLCRSVERLADAGDVARAATTGSS
jgi:2-methylcitrate dehydratase PrpD